MSVGEKALARLASALPRGARGALGRGLGGLGHAVFVGRRRRATEALEALPELDAAARRRLVRRSFAARGEAALVELAAMRRGAVDFCRPLRLEGWEHLLAAERGGRGVVLVGARHGLWRIPPLALAIYRSPLPVGLEGASPLLERALGRFGARRQVPAEAEAALRREGRAFLFADDCPPAPHACACRLLGDEICCSALPARLALATGAPLVPVFGAPADGGYRVTVAPAIEPEAGTEESELTRRYFEVLEDQIRRQPELWPWT